ncbi:hypothetical protein IEN91_05275 [Bacillus velezensis]|uniref:hypothetical protein n=1 Tax=Bacillus velezensis TaxID=492670 RepID=UPI0018C7CCDD|nr:hypothetical protein [Bacillus velezensis]QPK89850.1 hypothetical protein IEN91_05275 [Bacillus velezensis]
MNINIKEEISATISKKELEDMIKKYVEPQGFEILSIKFKLGKEEVEPLDIRSGGMQMIYGSGSSPETILKQVDLKLKRKQN